ncbi:MAG TPA: hypothetical protein VGM27_20505 [Acidobacteriaceae bacterium]
MLVDNLAGIGETAVPAVPLKEQHAERIFHFTAFLTADCVANNSFAVPESVVRTTSTSAHRFRNGIAIPLRT